MDISKISYPRGKGNFEIAIIPYENPKKAMKTALKQIRHYLNKHKYFFRVWLLDSYLVHHLGMYRGRDAGFYGSNIYLLVEPDDRYELPPEFKKLRPKPDERYKKKSDKMAKRAAEKKGGNRDLFRQIKGGSKYAPETSVVKIKLGWFNKIAHRLVFFVMDDADLKKRKRKLNKYSEQRTSELIFKR